MKKILALTFVFLLSACSHHMTDLSIISNKNVNVAKLNLDKANQVKHVSGRDDKFTILWWSIGTPNLQTALNQALKKADGDVMIDASLYGHSWSIFLFGRTGIEIVGTVVKTRGEK